MNKRQQEMIRLLQEQPEKTQMQFLADNDITQHALRVEFGRFTELKVAAGLAPNREDKKVIGATALNASLELYRGLNKQAAGLDTRYLRDSGGDFKTVLVAPDIHGDLCDPFYLRCLLRAAEIAQPDIVSFPGDLFECAELSSYQQDYRDWNPSREIKFVHEEVLRPMREIVPDAQLDLIIANHEIRALHYLQGNAPAVLEILEEMHGFSFEKFFGLEEFEMNVVAKVDFKAYRKQDIKKELRKNTITYSDTLMVSHYSQDRNLQIPGISAHAHSHIVWNMHNATYGSYEWHQSGAGRVARASFCEPKWSNGFVIANIHVPTKRVVFDYIDTTGDFSVIAGEFLTRTEEERVPFYGQ